MPSDRGVESSCIGPIASLWQHRLFQVFHYSMTITGIWPALFPHTNENLEKHYPMHVNKHFSRITIHHAMGLQQWLMIQRFA